MSKQSMQKGTRGGGGESSSGTRKQQSPRDGDHETALRLQKMFDEEDEYPSHRPGFHKQRSPRDGDHETGRRPQKMFDQDESPNRPGFHKQQSPRDGNYRTARLPKIEENAKSPDHRQVQVSTDKSLAREAPSKASSRDSASPYPERIQAALDKVQEFIAEVMETTCCNCDSALMHDFDVHRWFKQWTSTKGQPPSSISSLTCQKKDCQALTCLGCGQKPRMGKYTGKIDGFHLDWCCQSGRLFTLWGLLCEFDNIQLIEQERSRRHVQQSSMQPTNGPSTKKGTGYVSGPGLMYSPLFSPLFSAHETLSLRSDSKTDASTKQMLALIIELLPRRSDRDKAAPPAMGPLIELSLVQDRIDELLRNDSLQNATTRAGLYFAVFEFFERLGKHSDTAYLICEERFVKKQSSGLFVISTSRDFKGKGKPRPAHHLTLGQGEDSTTASLQEAMSNIGKQSDALLRASQAVKSEFRTADAQDLLEIADRIAKLQLSMQPHILDPRTDRKDMTWKAYNEKYCMTREENVLHHVVERLKKAARDTGHSPPNRIKRLVTEASEMATSLPPNIFVKVDEVRPDVMKSLIVGPADTPYEGGLFEFDIYCPSNYPQSPPVVIFCNTGGGRINFNPNLHSDGKVCLSLLGTFSGPPESQWQGAKSTILSVLVSIQAMIFSPNPLENMPTMWERDFDSQNGLRASESYSSFVQSWTVRFAMLDWLQKNEMRKGVWRDVVKTYFERNGGAILAVVNRWRSSNYLIGPMRGGDLGRELANALQAFERNRR
ncbi:hypothetical protein MMC07_007324 [Pseudocyphellaria aurata]|nr:hypothetical protein [Pseudocyphellaria aurata]